MSRLVNLSLSDVDTDCARAVLSKPERKESDAGSQIENSLARKADAESFQQVEESLGVIWPPG